MKKKELHQVQEAERASEAKKRHRHAKAVEYEERASLKDKFNVESDSVIAKLHDSNFELKQTILKLQ